MERILKFLIKEPAILSGFAGIVAWTALNILDVVEASSGEWTTVILTLLGAAGITRQNVSPTTGA